MKRLLPIFLLIACRTTAGDVDLKTDETRGALRKFCRDAYADGDTPQRVAKVCSCLKERWPGSAAERFCTEAPAYFQRLIATGKAEATLVITGDDGATPSASDRDCADGLAEMNVEMALDAIEDQCRKDDRAAILSLIDLPVAAPDDDCWRLTRMDQENCVIATSCTGRGPKRPDRRMCHPIMQQLHKLKDPKQQNLDYNYPFANYLAQNRSSANVTYGAANCHGTAQALAGGGFLEKLPVTDVGFHSEWIERDCGDKARAAFNAFKTNGTPLPIDRGGYVVNMVHDKSCSPTSCGKVTFNTFQCGEGGTGPLESHIFVQDMCIHCWDKMLADAGLKPLPATASWRDLKPGCIMTASDHSITTVFANDGLCYFYESLSPFAPPQVGVDDCPSLYRRFPGRWCPDAPLQFALKP